MTRHLFALGRLVRRRATDVDHAREHHHAQFVALVIECVSERPDIRAVVITRRDGTTVVLESAEAPARIPVPSLSSTPPSAA